MIVRFLNNLHLTVLKDDSFQLSRDFYVQLDDTEMCIPEGFTTDLASVPRVPFVYIAVGGRGHKAAVIHDFLYFNTMFTREICDKYFYYALRESGVNYFYAKAMYLGVCAGGGAYYNKRLNAKIT